MDNKKWFIVSGQVTSSIFPRVQASSAKEAKEEAEDRSLIRLCHQCGDSDSRSEEWVTSGELDGTPQKVLVEEE